MKLMVQSVSSRRLISKRIVVGPPNDGESYLAAYSYNRLVLLVITVASHLAHSSLAKQLFLRQKALL